MSGALAEGEDLGGAVQTAAGDVQMKMLDVTAGYHGIWFDKKDPIAEFWDVRSECRPDVIRDIRYPDGPIEPNEKKYDMVVFDPPHTTWGPRSQVAKRYGAYHAAEIRDLVQKGAFQIHKLLKDGGFLVFKWNTHEMPLEKILALMPQFRPLFGQRTATRTKHASSTYWVVLVKKA
jgi:hypothetical protein